mmetsp:Transcript_107657/g.301512  ORF Transcript_107657/g.301512 Transcript_107657/m.301512 type:complete len:199 (-) Transcript_107657:60-656(-)
MCGGDMDSAVKMKEEDEKGAIKQGPAASTPSSPELTPELRERIRKNRERALKIQAERKRKLEQDKHEEESKIQQILKGADDDSGQGGAAKKSKLAAGAEGEMVDCEDWEVGLSEWVTKKEAVAKYCLPEGTLAVCEVSTKDNPRNKGWASMKLYKRSELRERAYKRHGGKEGLIKERTQREQKRLAKDLKAADKIFQS